MELTPEQRALLDESVAQLQLPVRTTNSLESFRVLTVRDLLNCCPKLPEHCGCSRKHLLDIPNFGHKTLDQVFKALARHGFERKKK